MRSTRKTQTRWKKLSRARRARLEACIVAYLKRRYRIQHPAGSFTRKTTGRELSPWFPSAKERQPCCASIREPSAENPLSLNSHCRSAAHLAHLYDVDLRFLRQQLRSIRRYERESPVRSPLRIDWERIQNQATEIQDSGYRYPPPEPEQIHPQPAEAPRHDSNIAALPDFVRFNSDIDEFISDVEKLISHTEGESND